MAVYAGIDLHSTNSYVAVVDGEGKKVYKKKLSNDGALILEGLEPYRRDLKGVVIESTFNWYWLVDLLMEDGYRVHLANPAAIQKYKGLKHSDDRSDALWLAEMLRLGILPEGYIYPKEDRPVRDLLRKRSHLVKLRTSVINSLQNIITRSVGGFLSGNKMKQLTTDHVAEMLDGEEHLALTGRVSKEVIDHLTRQIKRIEKAALKKVRPRPQYRYLVTMPGVGEILGLTITLETGDIGRFLGVGNYASYCRKVPVSWTSNDKKKGRGNKKNGNKYLSWAFAESAELARRFDPLVRSWYNRKAAKTNMMVARTALAHKLARAAYHMMKEEAPFDQNRLFGCSVGPGGETDKGVGKTTRFD
jgi:transposase